MSKKACRNKGCWLTFEAIVVVFLYILVSLGTLFFINDPLSCTSAHFVSDVCASSSPICCFSFFLLTPCLFVGWQDEVYDEDALRLGQYAGLFAHLTPVLVEIRSTQKGVSVLDDNYLAMVCFFALFFFFFLLLLHATCVQMHRLRKLL